MRIGIASLQLESNTFNPTPVQLDDFRAVHLLVGAELTQLAGAHHEVSGFIEELNRQGVEVVPLLAAVAAPGGVLAAEAYAALLSLLDRQLERAGPLDGLLLAPHGAMVAQSAPDADGHWMSRVRRQVGPGVPIVAVCDPHANVSPAMIAATDALLAYQTNPHLDQKAKGIEAARLLVRTLRGELRPVQACCAPPMAIGIERQATAEPPCRDLMAAAAAAVRRDRILAASVVLGFPYADVAEMGSAVVVVADGDRAAAEQAAHELGRAMWDTRSELVGRFLSPEEAVAAAARADGTTCLLDMGDNVGGGSTGDGMALVGELMRQRVGPALAVIWDPTAAAAARAAGPGATVHLAVGGKSDPRYGPPLVAPFEVLARTDGRFAETEPRHGGRTAYDQGSTAVVRHGDVTLMLTTNRMPPFSLQQILHAGLTPRAFRVLVAKGVHAPVAAYAPVCERLIRVDTPGITAADMTRFELGRRRRPMFPFEPHAPFSPALGSGARD